MTNKKLSAENLDEEFYQITPEILESFPKFRLPLNLYIFKESVAQLEPYYRAEERLAKDKREEILELSKEGLIFVARADHHIYAKHISKQLDLVLVDKNLKPHEIIEIFQIALTKRISEFYEQPVRPTFEKLLSDISVLIEYLWEDQYRLKGLTKNLLDTYSLPNMAYNTGIIGIALFFDVQGKNLTKKHLTQIALGLFTYDLGLARLPKILLEKKQNLTPDEQNKINNHPLNGAKILRKLDITEAVTLQCHLEHHEYTDGSGYPRKLTGADISLSGGISALAHTFSEILTQSDPTPTTKEILNKLSAMKTKYNPSLLSSLSKIFLHDLMK
jgi:response regulator RpfG family c-di-GMP phosphodiesterase